MRGDLSFAKPPITRARLFLQKKPRRRLLLKKEGNNNAKSSNQLYLKPFCKPLSSGTVQVE